jgi:hypothetical protein
MRKPHIKVSHKSSFKDPYTGRSVKTSRSVERSGFASGGSVLPRSSGRTTKRLGDTTDLHLSGRGSPWSQAHETKKR